LPSRPSHWALGRCGSERRHLLDGAGAAGDVGQLDVGAVDGGVGDAATVVVEFSRVFRIQIIATLVALAFFVVGVVFLVMMVSSAASSMSVA
jgi:hypothetical protein